jgi:hypothetical protein
MDMIYHVTLDGNHILNFGGPPKPPSPADQLAADARKLAKEGKDLSSVTCAIDSAERERQRGIEKSLDATLELQKLSDTGKTRVTKEFILVYQVGDKAKTVRGVEWPDDRTDKTKNDYKTRVLIEHIGLIAASYHCMAALEESLVKAKILYRVAYID